MDENAPSTAQPGDDANPSASAGVVRVLCLDDSFYIAEAMRLLIADEEGLEVVGILGSADELAAAVTRHRPDILVMDLSMDGKAPLEALVEARSAHEGLRAIAYTGLDDAATVERVQKAGVEAFVSKRHAIDEVIAAIREVAAGERPRPRC